MAHQCHPTTIAVRCYQKFLFDNGQARLIRRRQTIEELLALELL